MVNDLDIMFLASLKAIQGLQHILNIMHHIFGLELTSIINLQDNRVDSVIRVTHLSSPTPVSYLTTSLRGIK